ncbi:MAG: uroporphyrinogen decarboxylase family protein [Anaerosomatales bacterium]|nr:uroporphyrinogen decarboxylase family protein [Anaerosomatales bacterium]MDI6843736.1 uroporphyrinogen decarboxylase family protein [Anaerosomatales bacterium]
MDRAALPTRPSITVGLTFVGPGALRALAAGMERVEHAIVAACAAVDAAFAFVPWSEPSAPAATEALMEAGVAPFAVVDGVLAEVLQREGYEAGLKATLLEPERIRSSMESVLERRLDRVRAALDAGARAIVVAEDLAGSSGPLVAPDFAIETLMPLLATIADAATTGAVPAVWHSDGDVRSLLGAARKAGFSAVHAGGGLDFDGFERVFWAARAADLMTIGGIPTRDLAQGLTHAEVVGSRAGLLARAGKLLVADDGGMTTAAEAQAFLRAIAAAREAAGAPRRG